MALDFTLDLDTELTVSQVLDLMSRVVELNRPGDGQASTEALRIWVFRDDAEGRALSRESCGVDSRLVVILRGMSTRASEGDAELGRIVGVLLDETEGDAVLVAPDDRLLLRRLDGQLHSPEVSAWPRTRRGFLAAV